MRQQINLYQPIFRKERKLFSALTVAIACGFIALAYVGFWSYGSLKVGALQTEVEQMRRRAEAQQSMLDTATNLRATRANPAAIEQHIAELSRELASRTEALQVLRSGAVGEPVGFATRLEALARGHVQGLWLDHLILSGAPGSRGSVQLEGATLDPDLVPRYLQSLASEQPLQGTRFAQFAIERDKPGEAKHEAQIRFKAASADLMTPAREPT